MSRVRHLRDDRLYECYLAVRADEPLDPPVAEHLSDCAACGARYAALTDFLSALRAEATDEADEQFTPERLRAQREQIVYRLEHANRSARVIGFPGRVTQHIARASTRVAPRWLAATAAAGLLVGVAVGGTYRDSGVARSLGGANVSTRLPTGVQLTPQPTVAVAPAGGETIDDERFLMELEMALDQQNTRELQPFDELMPRAREISSQSR